MLGSVMMTTDSIGHASNRYDYDAYGTAYTGSFNGRNKIGYNGKQYDSGTGWYNYGFRDYNLQTGRFTTRDPIRDGSNWFAYCNGDPVNFVDLWGLCVSDKVKVYVYRDKKSYEFSNDRNNPKNTRLDTIVLYNSKTGEYKVFDGVQTVANYPSTDTQGNHADSCFMDTIGTCNFDIKLSTTTNVAEGTAATIANAKTLDGRDVNSSGYTENAKSEGRGLIHSDEKKDGSGESYNTPYSKQCFIMSKENNAIFFGTLQDWGVGDNTTIKGTVYETDRRDK